MAHRARPSLAPGATLALGIIGVLAGKWFGLRSLQYSGIAVATLSYLVVAFIGLRTRSIYSMCIFAALLCCALGDFLGQLVFLAGLWAFLAAHVFLVAAATRVPRVWRDGLVAGAVFGVVAAGFLLAIGESVPKSERFGIFAYTVAITAMVVLASAAARSNPLFFIGAALFFVSDLFVALWRYHGAPVFGFICYPLYYAACFSLALCIASPAAAPARAAGCQTAEKAASRTKVHS